MSTRAKKRTSKPAPDEETTGTLLAFVVKWVGIITAFTSLILGIVEVTKVAGDARERRRQIMAAVAVATQAQNDGDYNGAWHKLEEAQKTAEDGGALTKLLGTLDEPHRELRQLREDVAMAWLRDAHLTANEPWRQLVEPLLPVLEEAAAETRGVRQGDADAHIGWAYFLESRDGTPAIDPVPRFREALASDPGNPYAHVFWGHWILWNHGSLAEARQHFEAAVTARRDLPFARSIEVAALQNNHSPADDAELIRVANEMMKDHEPIDDRIVSPIWDVYYSAFDDDAAYELINRAVPAGEQIALIEALFERPNFDPSKIFLREAYLARLEEAAGRPDAALNRWRALHSRLPRNISPSISDRCDAALKRLSPGAKTPR